MATNAPTSVDNTSNVLAKVVVGTGAAGLFLFCAWGSVVASVVSWLACSSFLDAAGLTHWVESPWFYNLLSIGIPVAYGVLGCVGIKFGKADTFVARRILVLGAAIGCVAGSLVGIAFYLLSGWAGVFG